MRKYTTFSFSMILLSVLMHLSKQLTITFIIQFGLPFKRAKLQYIGRFFVGCFTVVEKNMFDTRQRHCFFVRTVYVWPSGQDIGNESGKPYSKRDYTYRQHLATNFRICRIYASGLKLAKVDNLNLFVYSIACKSLNTSSRLSRYSIDFKCFALMGQDSC